MDNILFEVFGTGSGFCHLCSLTIWLGHTLFYSKSFRDRSVLCLRDIRWGSQHSIFSMFPELTQILVSSFGWGLERDGDVRHAYPCHHLFRWYQPLNAHWFIQQLLIEHQQCTRHCGSHRDSEKSNRQDFCPRGVHVCVLGRGRDRP